MADGELFSGVGVALVTLFDDDYAVDASATADLAAQLVELGVRSVVVAGTTGEAATLEPAERTALVSAVRKAVPDTVSVIAGTGAATGRQAAAMTASCVEAGADGVLVLSPARVDDPRAYYQAVVQAGGGVPVLAYHFPAVSSPGIAVELLGELGVDGVKDSSGDPGRLLRELDEFGGVTYVGSSMLTLMAGAVGAHGAILALANCVPELCIAAFGGDGEAQRKLLGQNLRSRSEGLKTLVAERFGTSRVVRLGT